MVDLQPMRLEDPGYEWRLTWRQEPYAEAPDCHWSYRQNYCDSGPSALEWLVQWLSAFDVSKVKDVELSRRQVQPWQTVIVPALPEHF